MVRDQPVPADAIFLLNGAIEARAPYAAELYLRGLAPRVVIAQAEGDLLVDIRLRRGWTELSVETMRMLGVPPAAIEVLPFDGGTTSTEDEAIAFARYLEARPARRVLVVTSDYHTRRAQWTLRRALHGTSVDLRMTPPEDVDAYDWWERESSFLLRIEEYLKFLHTWIRGFRSRPPGAEPALAQSATHA